MKEKDFKKKVSFPFLLLSLVLVLSIGVIGCSLPSTVDSKDTKSSTKESSDTQSLINETLCITQPSGGSTITKSSLIEPGAVNPSTEIDLTQSIGEIFTEAATSIESWNVYSLKTGLVLNTITKVSDTKVTLNFKGTAKEGYLTVQAKAAAISSNRASNILIFIIIKTVYGEIESSTAGINLYYAKNTPILMKAIVVIVHGLDEHLGRYNYVANRLCEFGYGVYRFDLRGHGQSGGIRAYVDDYNDFINDTDKIVDMVKAAYPKKPVYMLGHSMGGFITAAYGIVHPDRLKGQILSGAATMVPASLQSWVDNPNALYIIYPMYQIPNSLADYICRDPEVVAAYKNDPLVLTYNTAKLLGEVFVEGDTWLGQNVANYNYPCLILHGGNDLIVPNAFSQWLYDSISSADKTFKIYPDCYHEIMNEKVEKNIVLEDIHKWLDSHVCPW